MIDSRPNPDQLLAQIKREQIGSGRGRLKIFFGATAGVGKTYAMLSAAHQQEKDKNVLIGIVETHGRKETLALVEGLKILPLKEVEYKGRQLKEFDLDQALLEKPDLILMDELAHSNVPGSRHPKRWQDVDELLSAGIDVYSTINVQHLETLNDVVGGITGVRVWETVPDHVFDSADEVVLVDLPPDELLKRLKDGKVYLPQQAERASQNFFRKGNLIALRELALRRSADRLDHEVLKYRKDNAVSNVWQTRESILACIGPGDESEKVVRSAARIAGQLQVPWHAVYVETPALQRLPKKNRERVLKVIALAEEMGARAVTIGGHDAAETVATYAREQNLSRLVVGSSVKNNWYFWQTTFLDAVARHAPDLDLMKIARGSASRKTTEEVYDNETWLTQLRAPWHSFALSLLICGLTGLIAAPLNSLIELPNIAMFFLLAVVLVSVKYGLGPSLMASLVNVLVFDYFFVPPRFSFAVSDVQYVFTFIVMFVVGLITAKLTTGLTYQAKIANRREQRVKSLYEMSRDLSGALVREKVAEISQHFVAVEFKARSKLLLADDDNQLEHVSSVMPDDIGLDMSIAQWAFDHDKEAGNGTDSLPGVPLLYIPLRAPMRTRGVLVIDSPSTTRLRSPEQRRLLDTFARLLAISIERIHYVTVAQQSSIQVESERLRNSLLSAISHDLRTPLTALVGLADALEMLDAPLSDEQRQITAILREKALKMSSQVGNLLDMARLQSGAVRLNQQWLPIEEVIGTSIKAAEPMSEGRRVSVDLPADFPLLKLDPVLMERVFVNLLENAYKYTGKTSKVSIGGAAISPNQVEVWVQDDGPGLPAGKEEAIFRKFERGQKESAIVGVGLGLTICRAIIEAHNGKIRGETTKQGGARFSFILPIGRPPKVDLMDHDH
jgi:two-component system sensor histidine kinase KdpD